ncbi:MAG: sulfite oxidase [Thermoplasmata archaeon]|nr:sulfite oxidase [Thermoplasmata archaeon]
MPARQGGIRRGAGTDELTDVTATPRCAEARLGDIGPGITPVSRFFVRSHLPIPVELDGPWQLEIEGEVERPYTLTREELSRAPHLSYAAVMECAGNSRDSMSPKALGVPWGHGAVGNAEWSGVPLRSLLERAGLRPGAVEVVLEGADHGIEKGVEGEQRFSMSLPLRTALDPRVLVADRMNGAPLTQEHGYPMRAIVPGWYGMAWVKWLRKIRLLDRPFEGYYRSKSYVYLYEGDASDVPVRPVTVQRVKSLITWPAAHACIAPGRHTLRGIAWSGCGPIVRVEVDVGTTPAGTRPPARREAKLGGAATPSSWTPWRCEVDLVTRGYYVLRARAADSEGNVQPDGVQWNVRGVGNNSVHEIPVLVDDPTDKPDPKAPPTRPGKGR